jgi:outer membrane protein assembly factor BamB
MNPSNYIFAGVKGQVAAIDKSSGQTLWTAKLKTGLITSGFVTLLVEENKVYAHTNGELYCLDIASGQVLWKNALPGMGYEIASLATTAGASSPGAAAIIRKRASDSTAASASF